MSIRHELEVKLKPMLSTDSGATRELRQLAGSGWMFWKWVCFLMTEKQLMVQFPPPPLHCLSPWSTQPPLGSWALYTCPIQQILWFRPWFHDFLSQVVFPPIAESSILLLCLGAGIAGSQVSPHPCCHVALVLGKMVKMKLNMLSRAAPAGQKLKKWIFFTYFFFSCCPRVKDLAWFFPRKCRN